jgi:peptidoglycan pentaglycine glycine transferase (the first glycine)
LTTLLITPTDWNELIASLPSSHLLQTWEWGQVKAHTGWNPYGVLWNPTSTGTWEAVACQFQPKNLTGTVETSLSDHGYTNDGGKKTGSSIHPDAAALLLQRSLALGRFSTRLSVLYAPKGPLLDWDNLPLRRKVLLDLPALAHQRGAIFVKVDPDVRLGEGIPGQPDSHDDPTGQSVTEDLHEHGWHYSDEQIQFRNTVLIDLTPGEDVILGRMKQKTRYNLRLAERKGVIIRLGTPADWGLLYRMYAETSLRDGFVIRDENYYRTVWETFSQRSTAAGTNQPEIEALIAEVAGEPVAAVVIYRFAGKAWYLSGMSVEAHREKMPNYLLQWEAMRRAKAAGCSVYDLWGAPEHFTENDPLWGVFRFKEGLGGKVVRTLGAWDYPARPALYRGYAQVLPRLLDVMRRRGNERTRQITIGN